MTDDEWEYHLAREREHETRLLVFRILVAIFSFPAFLMLFTYIDNAGQPHRWAIFFYRLGIDYWNNPVLQWFFH